jgi:hypothetical protein
LEGDSSPTPMAAALCQGPERMHSMASFEPEIWLEKIGSTTASFHDTGATDRESENALRLEPETPLTPMLLPAGVEFLQRT